tara:strand:+ start:47077 stop:47460 length:384 start_codon:yes stop_codon:yes gene_type:complete
MSTSEPTGDENADPNEAAPNASPGQGHIQVTESKSEKKQIAQFITTIKNAEQQVGEHIIAALQHDDTVAVLTTVAMGADGQQRVISASLSPERMKQVQEILQQAELEREEEEPCVGFHCLVKPRAKS